MILCSQIQQLAYRTINSPEGTKGYTVTNSKYANALNDEARRLQIRIKDNEALVLKWCRRIDGRRVYTHEFFEDGASIYPNSFEVSSEGSPDCRPLNI